MKTTFTLLVLLSLFGLKKSSAQCVADTNHIYKFTYNSKKYEVVKEMQTWMAAAACAKERGGYLVEIADAAEQTAVYNAILTGAGVLTNYTSVPDGGGTAYVWIGAADRATEGTWLWDGNNDSLGINFFNGEGNNGAGTGSLVAGQYAHWGSVGGGGFNEPDNYAGVQDAAGIALAGWPSGISTLGVAGEWNDLNPTNQLYYVIEYPVSSANGFYTAFKNQPFKISPNPVTTELEIHSTINGSYTAEIISTTGQIIASYSFLLPIATINTTNLVNGVYVLKVKSVDGICFQKFIKQ